MIDYLYRLSALCTMALMSVASFALPYSNVRTAKTPCADVLPRLNSPLRVVASVDLMGICVYSENPDYEIGIYRVPTGTSNMVDLVAPTPSLSNVQGGCLVKDRYYVNSYETFWGVPIISHVIYDVNTWEELECIMDGDTSYSTLATDMTYDSTTGNIYGCFYDDEGENFRLAIQDQATFKTTPIGDLNVSLNSIAAAPDGKLYGISHSGSLYLIDKNSAEETFIGDTGVYPQYMSSATIDQRTGVMYWTVSDDFGGYLYTVDTATAAVSLVSDFVYAEEMVGLFIAAPVADKDAPDSVSDLSVVFVDDSLSGSITFGLPTKTFGGTALDAIVDYTLYRNDIVISHGSGNPGQSVEIDDAVPQPGSYLYVVSVAQGDKSGPNSSVELWVGPDMPIAPRGVTLEYIDGVFYLDWQEVTQSLHGGYLNGDIVYGVTLYAGDVVIASQQGIASLQWKYAMESPEDYTLYHAAVEAYTDLTVSATAVSNNVALGALSAPFFEDFDDVDSLLGYDIIDANGDGVMWKFDGAGHLYILYSTTKPMDDWIMTPPVKLQAGRQYHFLLGAQASNDAFPEAIEVRMGSDPTPKSMTEVLIEPTTLLGAPTRLIGDVVPDADGVYYFGVHGVSKPDMFCLSVDYIGLTKGLSVNAPDSCKSVVVVPDSLGALSATVKYVSPDRTIVGNASGVSKIEIYRDGMLLCVNDRVDPAQAYTFVDDTILESGYYTYTVIPYNEAGEGEHTEVTVFVGIGVPAPPRNVNVIERGNTGEVQILWEAPSVDEEGNYIDPSNMIYTVVDGNGEVVAEDISDTSIVCQNRVDGQAFVYYGVYAVSKAGASKVAESPIVSIGEPLQLPIAESFDNGGLTVPMAIDQSGGGVWSVVADNEILGMTDADGTNGSLVMQVEYKNQYAEVTLGKIFLDAKVPVMSLSTFCLDKDDINYIDVMVRDCATGVSECAAVIYPGKGNHREWNESAINLSAYAGKCVVISLNAVAKSNGYLFVDAIKIAQPVDIDLCAEGILAPANVNAGEEFVVEVDVANLGANSVDSYDVQMLLNGDVVDSKTCSGIDPLQRTTVSFSYAFPTVVADENVLSAVVVCPGDVNPENNSIAASPVGVVLPKYPVAIDLKAKLDGGVSLSWLAPDLSELGMQSVTDDFEQYKAFSASNIGNWTLVDGDGDVVGGLSGVEIPGLTTGRSTNAYFVMNYVALDLNYTFEAHSGQQYMMSIYTGYKQSDWLITPELLGREQTISFFARSYSSQYGLEEFEVYYSTTDQEIGSFTLIDHVTAPVEWTEYSYTVPDGTKYFAIVCVSTDRLAFFVDDVTYTPAGAQPLSLEVAGYNIYRNGVRINKEPVTDTAYVDVEGTTEDVYVVTVVYDKGESAPSNRAKADDASVGDALADPVIIDVDKDIIYIRGCESNVCVYNMEGRLIYESAPRLTHVVKVPVPALYLVHTQNGSTKVLAR